MTSIVPGSSFPGGQTFDGADPGLVPASSGNTDDFLRADGVWAIPIGTGITSVSGTATQVSVTTGNTPVVALVTTAVATGSYTNSSLTVDAFGRLTAASSGPAIRTIASGGTGTGSLYPGALCLVNSSGNALTSLAGALNNDVITWNGASWITSPAPTGGGSISSVTGTAGQISVIGTTAPIVALITTPVASGPYVAPTVAVDSFGRITGATSNTYVTLVSGTAAQISVTSGATPVATLIPTAVAPGSYINANVTVDSFGRITTAANGPAGISATVFPVSGSACGNLSWSEPFRAASYKKVVVVLTGWGDIGNVLTFPTAFINTPLSITTAGVSATLAASTLTLTALTLPCTTGAIVSGTMVFEGI